MLKRLIPKTFAGLGLICAIASAQPDVIVYVAPNGNDSWSGDREDPNPGRSDGPFATLEGARAAVRKLNAEGCTVLVRDGVYHLPRTFTLDERDSGTTYRAFPGEKPVLTGACLVTGFVPHKNGILKADVAALGLKGVVFRQLFCNGKRQELARRPNADPEHPLTAGWAFVPGPKLNSFYSDREKGDRQRLPVPPEMLRKWAHPEDAEVFIFARFNWINQIVGIRSIDREKHALTLAQKLLFAPAPDDRFFLRNLFEELDDPGEWFLDKHTWTLYFQPPAAAETMVIEVPRLKDLIAVDNAAKITIQGFTIERCDGNGVVLRNSTDCLVAANTIRQVGGYCAAYSGINIVNGKRNGAVGNDIYDIGADAVRISGGDLRSLTPAGNCADNNYMHHLGVFKRASQGVAMYGVGNRVSHNLIHDSPRAGIAGSGNDLIIEFNRIRHVNLETEDSAAIYLFSSTAGFCRRGMQVRYNYISDSLGFGRRGGRFLHPFYAHGIYLDDAVCGNRVCGNIVVRTTSDPVYIHGGSDNVVENNVIVDSGKGQMMWQIWSPSDSHWLKIRREYETFGKLPAYLKYPHYADLDLEGAYQMKNNSFQRNIICYSGPKRQAYTHTKLPLDMTTIDHNLIHSGGQPVVCGLPGIQRDKQWAEWRKLGLDTHSVVADPDFVDPEHGNYHLKPGSPALALGFEPIAIDKIGPYESPLRASWPIQEAEGAREHPLVLAEQSARNRIPKPKPFTAHKVSTSIAVDGVAAPGEWPQRSLHVAQHVSAYSVTENPCTARACHNGEKLYVTLTVPVRDVAKLRPSPPWNDGDAAEVCFANGTGTVFVIHGYADGTYESVCDAGAPRDAAARLGKAALFAARIQGDSWTAEWAIPFAAAGIVPKPGMPIPFNVGVHRTETREWIMWAGTGGSSWLVENAGTLVLE